jgi:hypothetical protein
MKEPEGHYATVLYCTISLIRENLKSFNLNKGVWWVQEIGRGMCGRG